MTWRARRQLIGVGIVGILVLLIVGYFIFQLLDKEPTCFDGKQNGQEEGVDCGGDCAKVCSADAREMLVLWSRAFHVTDDVYNVVAYLENRNPDAGIRRIPYEFQLYDTNNIIVAERSGETFIGPNRRTAVVETSITTGNRKPRQSFFNFKQKPAWYDSPDRFSKKILVVDDQQLTNVSTRPRLEVVLSNTTLDPVYDIEVVALVYDLDGNAMQVSTTRLDKIGSSSKQTLYFTWPEPFPREVSRVEILPRINVFSDRNQL